MKRMLMSALLLSLVAACASTPTEQPRAAVEEKAPTLPPPAAQSKPVESVTIRSNPLTDPNNILSKRSVYFAFDSSAVEDKYKPQIDAHAGYLKTNKGAKTFIQGNCDERGSREYNLALGQRRADAVRKIMSLHGVGEAQMETVSFGEEKPRAPGHDEAAWAENRRADIVYQGE